MTLLNSAIPFALDHRSSRRWSISLVRYNSGAVSICRNNSVRNIWRTDNLAVVVNRFFSPVVRLQEDRGQHLSTLGPYRFVRHPGYLGMVLPVPASGLALGLSWGMVPAIGYALIILRPAELEDKFLRRHLIGYDFYADAVRYRILPGIW